MLSSGTPEASCRKGLEQLVRPSCVPAGPDSPADCREERGRGAPSGAPRFHGNVKPFFYCKNPERPESMPEGTRTARARRTVRRAPKAPAELLVERGRGAPSGAPRFHGNVKPFFYCKNSEHPESMPEGTRKAAKATAACGGNREPEQGPRSQRRRPAPRGAGRCGHRNPYVPAVLRPGRARQSSGLSGRARGRGAPSGAPQPYRTCKAVFYCINPARRLPPRRNQTYAFAP